MIHSRPEVAPMLAWGIIKAWTTSRDALLNGHLVAVQLSTMLTAQQIVHVSPVLSLYRFGSQDKLGICVTSSKLQIPAQPRLSMLITCLQTSRPALSEESCNYPFTPRWIPSRERGPGPSSHSGGAVQRNSMYPLKRAGNKQSVRGCDES